MIPIPTLPRRSLRLSGKKPPVYNTGVGTHTAPRRRHVKCPEDTHLLNPYTNRCVRRTSRTGRQLLGLSSLHDAEEDQPHVHETADEQAKADSVHEKQKVGDCLSDSVVARSDCTQNFFTWFPALFSYLPTHLDVVASHKLTNEPVQLTYEIVNPHIGLRVNGGEYELDLGYEEAEEKQWRLTVLRRPNNQQLNDSPHQLPWWQDYDPQQQFTAIHWENFIQWLRTQQRVVVMYRMRYKSAVSSHGDLPPVRNRRVQRVRRGAQAFLMFMSWDILGDIDSGLVVGDEIRVYFKQK